MKKDTIQSRNRKPGRKNTKKSKLDGPVVIPESLQQVESVAAALSGVSGSSSLGRLYEAEHAALVHGLPHHGLHSTNQVMQIKYEFSNKQCKMFLELVMPCNIFP